MRWKIGHRGASGNYPENTLLAFRKAIEMGANALEFDVHVCQSGEPVVIHDSTLKRTTGMRGRVSTWPLAKLAALNAGQNERIPTLKEVLAEFAADYTLFIEIKSAATALPTGKLISQFAKKGVPYEHMPVIGFKAPWLIKAREADKRILIGITPGDRKRLNVKDCERAQKLGAWSINPGIKQLNKTFVEDAHARGLHVITWTANTVRDIEKATRCGVDGIISDYPEKL